MSEDELARLYGAMGTTERLMRDLEAHIGDWHEPQAVEALISAHLAAAAKGVTA